MSPGNALREMRYRREEKHCAIPLTRGSSSPPGTETRRAAAGDGAQGGGAALEGEAVVPEGTAGGCTTL